MKMRSEVLLWSPDEKRKAGTQVELFEQLPELLS